MPLDDLQKILDRPLQSYDAVERRALEMAQRRWRTVGMTNDDFSSRHKQFVIETAKEIDKVLRAQPPASGPMTLQKIIDRGSARDRGVSPRVEKPAPPARPKLDNRGVTRIEYADGSVLIGGLDERVPLNEFRGPPTENYFDEGFVPYGRDGSKIQGPQMATDVDLSGRRYGNVATSPQGRTERDRLDRLARKRAAGIPDSLPDAPMTNARGASAPLKFSPKAAPTLASGTPAYGNPASFPSRDGWRSRFEPGANLNGGGENGDY